MSLLVFEGSGKSALAEGRRDYHTNITNFCVVAQLPCGFCKWDFSLSFSVDSAFCWAWNFHSFLIHLYSSFFFYIGILKHSYRQTQTPTGHSHQWHTQVQTHHRVAVKEPKLTKMHSSLECCQVDLFEKLSVRSHFLVSVCEAKPMQQIRSAQQNSEPVRARKACNYSCQMILSHPNHLSVFPCLFLLCWPESHRLSYRQWNEY